MKLRHRLHRWMGLRLSGIRPLLPRQEGRDPRRPAPVPAALDWRGQGHVCAGPCEPVTTGPVPCFNWDTTGRQNGAQRDTLVASARAQSEPGWLKS